MDEYNNKGIEFNLEICKQKLGFSLSEKTIDKIANATSTLFAPATAWLNGQSAKITCSNLPFYDKLAERKDENIQKLFVNVLTELKEREENKQEIPEKFDDTENLLLIQENASTTSNEEFLKLWAKLYTEEVCNQGTISRKTIKIVESLDINIVKILQNDILPYCDSQGFYWGNIRGISNLLLLQDYGLIETNPICASSKEINAMYHTTFNNKISLYCYPNMACSAILKGQMYRLTKSALEIINNIEILSDVNQDYVNNIIFEHIQQSSITWGIAEDFKNKIKFKQSVSESDRFIICDDNNNVIYPINSSYKTLDEFYSMALQSIEVINESK